MATANLYESEGRTVVESRENVPPGRYEVRDPEGRRYGIWESVERAIRELHESRSAATDPRNWAWIDEINGGDIESTRSQ